MTINKAEVFSSLMSELDTSFTTATIAADSARDLATHEQSKPETQYDTVGLEASYLAHGQSQRVAELALAIEDWKALEGKSFDDDSAITAGALITVADLTAFETKQLERKALETKGLKAKSLETHYLIGNYSGGLKLMIQQTQITVISMSSPLGRALSDKCVGDEVVHPVMTDVVLEVISIR